MKYIKKDIPALAGLIATASIAVVSGGLINPTLTNIGASLSANFISGITPQKLKKWFFGIHPDDLNHSIKRLFIESVKEALSNISVLFSETKVSKEELIQAKKLVRLLQKKLPEMLLDEKQIKLDEEEIKHFLYKSNKEETIFNFIENQFDAYGVAEPFKSFLARNIPAQLQLCFGEGLKEQGNQNAWIAFQRMLLEEIRNDIKQIADTQKSIKEDLTDLKFEKSGFSEEQREEIQQFIKMLSNKKSIEVKIREGVEKSLQSIENKANEIIRITTQTQITVEELKSIVVKIKQQSSRSQIIIYSLAVCLFVTGVFIGYKFFEQPFTTTIQVYGWEGEPHNPLNGKGALLLTFGDKNEKAEINRQGEAVFKGILPQYKGKQIAIQITDTEGEPYYLTDSLVTIQKNNITKVQVLLYGLEKLRGVVFDNVLGEGLPNVTVSVAEINTTTNEHGYFCIDIPVEKQQHEQKIVIYKEGYETKRETVSMTGEYNTVLKRRP
jgi:hypothetical protein